MPGTPGKIATVQQNVCCDTNENSQYVAGIYAAMRDAHHVDITVAAQMATDAVTNNGNNPIAWQQAGSGGRAAPAG